MLTVLLGLFGLGIVVFVHEFGHFIAAKSLGVAVEAFSIGWGPRLAGFTRGGTDYRISVFPIGGFCAMKGEDSYRRAVERGDAEMPREPGTFYGASIWRRMLISASGPVFNLLFAIIVFSVVYGVGIKYSSPGTRIVLASESAGSERFPADEAGLMTGDLILTIDGTAMANFSKVQEIIAVSPSKPLSMLVRRNAADLTVAVTPRLDRKRGIGMIGVRSWVDPLIESVKPGSAAAFAGIEPGDLFISAAGKPVRHAAELSDLLANAGSSLPIVVVRRGVPIEKRVALLDSRNGAPILGVGFKLDRFVDRESTIGLAVARGFGETVRTISLTLKGFASLFSGVDLVSAVSGPARITYMVGEVASQGFETGVVDGLTSAFNFLALLSIGFFIMNLLPIPALDGGQIVLFAVEGLRRKPLRLRTIMRYQMVGFTFILAIFVMSTLADVLFFTRN
ncbi:MAG: RIP metalloprotease RseP [Spirochaetes bacterium]|nr:RIP metalloprotease RseP [Spirochaetota bacterium]